ncbi:penicillin acylase family protein [Streptomyces parvus]|uniref:penicillin acylase family protein n=1 Tax=Streptomyces parvus TaxID=66428 RepID=UPI003441B179
MKGGSFKVSIRIYRDPYGVPHLRADNVHELAFAQGSNAARDRGWQLEVERHRAQGTTAAFLGETCVPWDKLVRQARLQDTAQLCFDGLAEDTKSWVTAYVAGVNSGIEAGAGMAPQFAETGLTPGEWHPWTPLAVWLSMHLLFAGFPAKLWRGEASSRLGDDVCDLFAGEGPTTPGSNGWLLGGDRTTTGAPVLAGDPHRIILDPGAYQQIHLGCPEFDVIGLATPGVPGIAHFGHTGGVAWGITNSMADYQDLYRERLRRRGEHGETVEALGPEGWRPATAHRETIEVAHSDSVEIEVVETERGPVVIGGPDDAEAFSLRYPARVSADLGFDALLPLLRATRVADIDAAMDQWVEPVNVVQAADVDGGLLHRAAGRVPVRSRSNRMRPVPAWEAGHAWQGWYEPMPHRHVEDVAVMANERGIAAPLGVEFAAPHRAERIRHLLAQSKTWSATDMCTIHMDTYLPSAAPLLDLLDRLDDTTEAAELLRQRLLRWDRRMRADSSDAAAYAVLRVAVIKRIAAHPFLTDLGGTLPYPEIFQPWLALGTRVAMAMDRLLTSDEPLGNDRLTIARDALEEVAAHLTEPKRWGDMNKLAPWRAWPHPADETWPGMSGDHDCVLSAGTVREITRYVTRGPAARYVWDLARRDDSLWVVPFGASGIAGSPHQRDQLPCWLEGEMIPVVTNWDQLTLEHTEHPTDLC